MDFRVLGTLEVWSDGTRVALPSPRHQRVLAALLMAPRSVIPLQRLVDVLWTEDPPATAVKQVQNVVSSLRGRLRDTCSAIIVTDGPGYRVMVSDDQVDALRFRRGVDAATALAAAGRLTDAVTTCRAALALWRGPALDGIGAPALTHRATRLDEQRLLAIEQCIDWQFALGQHREVTSELAELVAENPLRERTHAQLMTALAGNGRLADALAVYQQIRDRLADELGIDPGAEIVALHERLLGGTTPPPAETARSGSGSPGLDLAARELAEAITRQWQAEVETRSLNRPRPVRLTWASTRRPVVASATSDVAFHGDLTTLISKFRQVPARQLVVLGEAGAGKSVIAILLTLGLLADIGAGDPVPVILPVASWDPHAEHLHVWLARRLRTDYPGLANAARYGPDTATRLVLEGRVLPVLDGLDETPPALHAAAIDALDRAAAGDRPLVVTCRTAEYERAVLQAGAILASAPVVEVEPVEPTAAIEFLTDRERLGRSRWQPVVDQLRQHPGGPLARALSTPLMVDLARSSYTDPAADPTELADATRFPDRAAVEEHLLDTFLPTAYAERPGHPDQDSGPSPVRRYDAEQAQRWLRFLAAHLHRAGTRDIAWWQLDRVLSRPGHGLVFGLPPALLVAATGWVAGGPRIGLIYGLAFAVGGVVANAFGRIKGPLSVELRFGAGRFTVRFAIGAAIGIALGMAWMLHTGAIVVLAFVFGLAIGSYAWLDRPVDIRRVSSPHSVLSSDRLAGGLFAATLAVSLGIFYGLAYAYTTPEQTVLVLDGTFDVGMGIAAGLAGGVLGQLLLGRWGSVAYALACVAIGGQVFNLTHDQLTPPVVGVLFGLGVGLAVFASRAWGAFVITRLWLALRGELPLRLMRFLDDAHRRGVLRQVGAVYQFRHARLQDRLATR